MIFVGEKLSENFPPEPFFKTFGIKEKGANTLC